MRRAIPACLILVLLLLFFSSTASFGERTRDILYHSSLSSGQFPRKIWQICTANPLGLEERDLVTARTWIAKNPTYRYEVLTDHNDLYYVETHFGTTGFNRPDIVYTYKALTARTIKAVLLRYLVMYVEGGVYTDIDVEALKPIDNFIPSRYNETDVDMVIGVEVDRPEFQNHTILGSQCRSFCQWTFMAKPRLPVMMSLIDNTMEWLYDLANRQGVWISDVELGFDEVISGTGPSAFTRAILAELAATMEQEVTWDCFHNLAESKLVGGVLVLPVEAFATGQRHSDSGNHNAETALVKHQYHASEWTTAQPRYNHPVYGEVEKCNWDVECVREWDANKAAFDALSPEEQVQLIAERQAADTAETVATMLPPPPGAQMMLP